MKRDRLSLIAVATIVILGVAAMVYLQAGDVPSELDSEATTIDDQGSQISRSKSTPATVPRKTDGEDSSLSETHVASGKLLPPAKADSAHVVGRVIDKEKSPIAGAVVALCLDISDFRSRGHVGRVIAHVVSDEEGYFQLPNVHVGEVYSLRAESPNYASKYVTGLELTAGSTKRFELTMHEGLSLKGLVTDLSDVPIDGARVYVQDLGMQVTDKLGGVERETRTGADGRFIIKNLNQGFKNLGASKPSFATKQTYNFHVHFSSSKQDIVFKLGPGERLSGTVVDGNGTGVDGVVITAQPHDVRSQRIERNTQSVRSNSDGRFVFDGLKRGDYNLTCKKLGYFSPLLRNLAKTSDSETTIRLKKNPVIRGQVVDADTLQPVTEFTLYSTPRESLLFVSENAKQAFKSKDGTFEFLCLRNKGDIFLHLDAPGYATGTSGKLLLSRQESIEGVVVKALAGATAVGRVVDSEGKPVAQASVEMETIPDGSQGLGRLGSMVYGKLALLQRRVRTDAEGKFRISRLRAANYRLIVKHGSHAANRGDRILSIKKGGEFPLGDIVLLKGGNLQGVAFDADNKPMPGVLIKLVPEDPSLTGGFDIETRTDSAGRFKIRHLTAGGYKLQVIRTARLAQLAGQLPNLPTAKYQSVFIQDGEEKSIEVRGL